MTNQLKAQAKQFVESHRAQLMARMEAGQTPEEAFRQVMEAEQSFLMELVLNQTERAQEARRLISDRVYHRLREKRQA